MVIIPTFASSVRRRSEVRSVIANYDHTTDINESGELGRCLESLERVDDIGLIIVLVAADHGIEREAIDKVRATIAQHPGLNAMAIGAVELAIISERMEQLGIERMGQQIGLSGYGAIRNLGLVLTCAMGFDAAVFINDDEVVDDPGFLHKAMYGLGKLTKNGVPILAKTGYYINEEGSYLSKWEDRWYNRFWQQGRAFNDWMSSAIGGPRLSRSNHVCGGCLAIHKEAFRRAPFDPWIPRGEDLDYLLSLRMLGGDIWFDNGWHLRHLPPASPHEGARFRQDIFRWIYEYFKLEYSHSLIDLQKVTAASLEPYPGPFLEKGLHKRIAITAFLRSLARPDKKAYRRAAEAASGEALRYGERNCRKYFEFQHVWPQVMDRVDSDKIMTTAIVQSALIEPIGRHGASPESPAPEEMAAASESVDAPAVSHSPAIDPGMTSQIRLDMGE